MGIKIAAYIIFLCLCIWFASHPFYIKGFGDILILPQIEAPEYKDFDIENSLFCVFVFYGVLFTPLLILDKWNNRNRK